MTMRFLTLLSITIGLAAAFAQAQTTAPTVLPAGHPPLPSAYPALPAGHPALPSGHPDISNATPATQPASHGSMAIRVMQGTKDGPPVKGEPLTVELYSKGQVIRKIDAKVDDTGVTIIDGLSLVLPFQPMVRMMHGGLEYSIAGEVMDGQHPDQQVDLTVFESTEQPPAWQVQMLHVMATPTPDGLRVMQMLAIQNPSDRTWRGKADDKGKRATLSLAMPPGAQDVVVSGLLEHGSALTEDGRLVCSEPLQPGSAKAQINYLIPGKNGQASFKVTTPAPVKTMILFVPDGPQATVQGLESAGVHDMGEQKLRMFRGSELKAGQEVTISVSLPQVPVAQNVAASNVPKIIAGVGVGLIVVIGAFVVVLKTPKAKTR
jgi:hypothetical protein